MITEMIIFYNWVKYISIKETVHTLKKKQNKNNLHLIAAKNSFENKRNQGKTPVIDTLSSKNQFSNKLYKEKGCQPRIELGHFKT